MKLVSKLLLLVFCAFCLFTLASASEDRAFFWKATRGDATVYLLGSIHFANKSFYPLRHEIEKAFEISDALVVEVSMDKEGANKYRAIIEGKGSYPANETIKDHISSETYQELKKGLAQLGLPMEAVHKHKPGIVVLTLTAAQVMKLGLDPALGIDQHFLSNAKGKMKVHEFETIEEQLGIFLDIPNGELMLKESLNSIDEGELFLTKMEALWKRGDEKAMHHFLFEDTLHQYPEFGTIYDRLFYQRNKRMSDGISKFLKEDKTLFIVVGAGHLIGDSGLPSSLEKKGFKVERL